MRVRYSCRNAFCRSVIIWISCSSLHSLDRAFNLGVGQCPVIVELGDHLLHERLGEREGPVSISELIVENGKRQLSRAGALIGPLESPFGELLDLVVFGQPTP